MKAFKSDISEKDDEELEYHLQCIRTFVSETEDNDESLDLKSYNLYDITSSLFKRTSLEDTMSGGDNVPSSNSDLIPQATSSSYVDTLIDEAMSSNDHTRNPFQDLEDYLADVVDPTLEDDEDNEPRTALDLNIDLRSENSRDSTLDTPTNYSSSLDTPTHPQRIVSQPCVDTLTTVAFPTMDGVVSDTRITYNDAADPVITVTQDDIETDSQIPDVLEIDSQEADPLEAANTGSITYVSPFSLETWGREGEEVARRSESVGARRQIRSVTSLYLDSSLKITQMPVTEDDGYEASYLGDSAELGNCQDSGFHSLDSSSTRHKNSSVSSLTNVIAETNSSDVLSVDLTTSGLTMCDGPLGPVKSKGVGTPDQVLTTLDRPRAQSLMGTPLRQAWVQVSCYERDMQTGNFLIDKHKVQIDGQFLHPELNNSPELYRISLTGLVNASRAAKTEKMLPDIGSGVILHRHPHTGNVTLTKLTDKDVFMLNKNFLNLKGDEKCKGKHLKLEKNYSYTIFDKHRFVEEVRTNAIDLSQIHTIGQVAIAFLKINSSTAKGIPCWVKIQCLEAMNLLKNLLTGSKPEDREWLRKQPDEIPPRRASNSRISFGKSLSKSSLKENKPSLSSSSDSSSTPIPRTKSEHVRSSRKKEGSPSGASRGSVVSQHLQPLALNYACEGDSAPPPIRDSILVRNSSTPSITAADVSLPLRRDEHSPSQHPPS